MSYCCKVKQMNSINVRILRHTLRSDLNIFARLLHQSGTSASFITFYELCDSLDWIKFEWSVCLKYNIVKNPTITVTYSVNILKLQNCPIFWMEYQIQF